MPECELLHGNLHPYIVFTQTFASQGRWAAAVESDEYYSEWKGALKRTWCSWLEGEHGGDFHLGSLGEWVAHSHYSTPHQWPDGQAADFSPACSLLPQGDSIMTSALGLTAGCLLSPPPPTPTTHTPMLLLSLLDSQWLVISSIIHMKGVWPRSTSSLWASA